MLKRGHESHRHNVSPSTNKVAERLSRWCPALLGLIALLMAITSAVPAFGQRSVQPVVRAALPRTATAVFVIQGLRSDNGQVMGGLFDSSRRWLHNGEEAATCRVRVRRGAARCLFSQLPPGRYAFAFAHDENQDGEFGRNVFGIPTEGYGFSNGVTPSLSAPSFDSAAFQLDEREVQVLDVRYGI